MADAMLVFASLTTLFTFLVPLGEAGIQCYQCDSNEDLSCPADSAFDKTVNSVVDCSTFEATVRGIFCAKIYQEGPGWRPWKKITRRCSFYSELGVAHGCKWTWEANGVFRESCYCESDGCNSAPSYHTLPRLLVIATSVLSIVVILNKL